MISYIRTMISYIRTHSFSEIICDSACSSSDHLHCRLMSQCCCPLQPIEARFFAMFAEMLLWYGSQCCSQELECWVLFTVCWSVSLYKRFDIFQHASTTKSPGQNVTPTPTHAPDSWHWGKGMRMSVCQRKQSPRNARNVRVTVLFLCILSYQEAQGSLYRWDCSQCDCIPLWR